MRGSNQRSERDTRTRSIQDRPITVQRVNVGKGVHRSGHSYREPTLTAVGVDRPLQNQLKRCEYTSDEGLTYQYDPSLVSVLYRGGSGAHRNYVRVAITASTSLISVVGKADGCEQGQK